MGNCTAKTREGQPRRMPRKATSEASGRVAEHAWALVQGRILEWENRVPGPDFAGAVAERLVKYAPTFDPDRSSLKAWAFRHALGACKDACREFTHWRRKGTKPKTYSLEKIQEGVTDHHESIRAFVLPNLMVTDAPGHLDRMDAFRGLIRGCNKVERLLLIGYYWHDRTMREIGADLGLSESRVSQMHSAILERLRGRLGDRAPAT